MRFNTTGMRSALVPCALLAASVVLGTPQASADSLELLEYVDLGCTEFDRYEDLTPNDTLTLITRYHNPEQARGFVVVYAVDESGNAISANDLVGNMMVINGIQQFEYSINGVDFSSPVADREATDLDGDDVRDLDGVEYVHAPDELLIPRFIGQSSGYDMPGANSEMEPFMGRLILVDLNSGREFNTTVDFLIYNDNEEEFSGEYTFNCWDNPRLLDISGAFHNQFLRNGTDHDDGESLGGHEAGWFRFEGALANSMNTTIADPAIYGVYVEKVRNYSASDLPFEAGSREGHILPRTMFGDNSDSTPPPVVGDPVQRRQPGSLVLYPEFDNLYGEMSLLTITNTNPAADVRVHFVYYGKYGFPDVD